MMITRSNDIDSFTETVLEVYPKMFLEYEFDYESWIRDENNIALTDGLGSFGLLTFEYPGMYSGHYFFKKRGKEARELATDMLTEMFANRGASAIMGLVPLQNLAARWMTRQLGFGAYGVVDTPVGPCEHFIISLDEFFEHKRKRKTNG